MIDEYQRFRKQYQAVELPNLALYKTSYPYGECVAIVGLSVTKRLKSFCDEESFHVYDMNGTTILSTIESRIDKSGTTYIFSGKSMWREKLIIGVDDICSHNIEVSELRESIGEFELLYKRDERLELSTDYFGMCQWYYYKPNDSNQTFVASTSYHLLLLTLVNLGVKLQLNTKKVSAGMGFHRMIPENSFTEHMDVEQCYELPCDKKIVIFNKEVFFENTSLFEEVRNPESYSEETYEKYLYQIKDELIANVRAVLEHPSFDYALLDLTGGADSRTLLAATLNLPHRLTKKIRINSIPRITGDFSIANMIVNAYGLEWDDIPKEWSCDNVGIIGNQICQVPQSYSLGTYYAGHFMPSSMKYKKTIHMTGGFGDALYHQVFSFGNYNKEGDDLFKQFGRVIDVEHSTNASRYFAEYVRNSILSKPRADVREQMELFYLYYRNRHHFKTKYLSSAHTWMPLQSKIAFCCYNMYLTHRVDDKLQHDLISLLNPLLANFPYEADKYNEYKEKKSEELYRKGAPKVEIVPCNDTKKWEATSSPPRQYVPDKETVEQNHSDTYKWYTSEKTLLSALKTFLEYSEEFDELGLPLYKYFVNDRHTSPGDANILKARINRILSAYWQIQIIGEKYKVSDLQTKLRNENERLSAQLSEVHKKVQDEKRHLEDRLDKVLNSTSWKMTKPIRTFMDAMKGKKK